MEKTKEKAMRGAIQPRLTPALQLLIPNPWRFPSKHRLFDPASG